MRVAPPLTVAAIVVLWLQGTSLADAPLDQRSLDLVVLRDAGALRGVLVTGAAAEQQQIVVDRAWLQQADPARYDDLLRNEVVQTRDALGQLERRIGDWKEGRPDAQNLGAFLSLEERRVARMLEELAREPSVPATQLLWLSIAAPQIKRVYRQPPGRRQIGLLAWRERLEQVPTRSAADLERELRGRDVAVDNETVDLSDRLPPLPQNDREWAARIALIEHHFVRRFELQGTGSLLVPADGHERPALGQLIGELYKSEVSKLLDEVGGSGGQSPDAAWVEKATALARRENLTGVRATRLSPDLTNQRISVDSRFLAQMPGGEWETIWMHVETADVRRERPERAERIRKDPQVRRALETLQALGAAPESSIDLAVRFGAATMEAQEAVNSEFQRFQEAYLRRLDGPPLIWPTR